MRLLWVLWLAGAGCTGASSETDGGPDTEVPAVLLGIGVSPRDPVVGVGGTVRFAVKAYYDDASTVDVSKDVSWLTTEPGVAGIDPSGLAVGLEPGIAGIVATDERGVATRTELIVRGGVEPPTALVLSPRVVEMAVGEQVALAARATWADGEEGNVASSCA